MNEIQHLKGIEIVDEIPRSRGMRMELHEETKAMLESIEKYPGKILSFEFSTPKLACTRASSLKLLQKKNKVNYEQICQRGNKIFVETKQKTLFKI